MHTTVQRCPKVLASKRDRQVGQVTSADRGTLVTVCFAVNAIGNVIPPFFIFPRVKYNESFVDNGPEGSDGDAYPSGWMTVKSFLKFMKHFVKYSCVSRENPTLLILDNHESHVSIEGINFAKENGITLLTLPPHCSNKLQPLDIAVYSSFKTRYNIVMSNWMLSNPGKTVTIYNIPGFVRDVVSQAFSRANIMSGFRKSGIHPFNPEIFGDEDFLCSAVTDREIAVEQGPPIRSPASPSILGMVTETAETNRDPCASSFPTTSTAEGHVSARSPIPSTSTADGQDAPKSFTTPEMIKPYPKAAPRKSTRRGRQLGKTKILTKSPEKNDQEKHETLKTQEEPKRKKPKKSQKINESK
ncbi:uncharacterized protein [Temnothorax nylanderi]|uniref:uncharacterized protein n=1 Tax=Temnothorax nylanderi TaxID=102681 RepID=UPI003A8B8BAD